MGAGSDISGYCWSIRQYRDTMIQWFASNKRLSGQRLVVQLIVQLLVHLHLCLDVPCNLFSDCFRSNWGDHFINWVLDTFRDVYLYWRTIRPKKCLAYAISMRQNIRVFSTNKTQSLFIWVQKLSILFQVYSIQCQALIWTCVCLAQWTKFVRHQAGWGWESRTKNNKAFYSINGHDLMYELNFNQI